MLEYPEIANLAIQANEFLVGKTIESAQFLSPDRKFVFGVNNQKEFGNRLAKQTIAHAQSCGNHIFLVMKSGMALSVGDTGGKLL